MRKRILCIALLSLLAVWLMPFSALAGTATTTDYYKLLSVKPNVTTFQLTGTYAASQTVDANAVTFTVDAQHRNAETAPSGFNSTATITWKVDVNPTSAALDDKGNNTLTIADSTLSSTNLAPVGVLTGKISAPCTITVTATQGGISKTASKVKLTPIEKPVVVENDDATKNAAQLIGTLGTVPTLWKSTATFDKATATIKGVDRDDKSLGAVLKFKNYPEYITITPSATELAKYGISYTDKVGNAAVTNTDAASKLSAAATTRDITFGGTAANILTPTPSDGIKITVKVWNKKVDGKDNTALTKEIALKLYAYPPLAFKTDAGTQVTKGADFVKDCWDLGPKATTAKDVPTAHTKLKGLKMVKADAEFGTNAKWVVENITAPVNVYAENLPDGLKIVADKTKISNVDTDMTTAKVAKNTFNFHLEGTPTKPGYYKPITIFVENAGGVLSKDYVMDVVEEPSITTTSLPDLTWGQAYTATIAAVGGENSEHPLTIAFQKDEIGPGITVTNAATGALSGKLVSSDAILSANTKTKDYALGNAKEKTVTLKLRALNDWSGTDLTKTEGVNGNVTLKIKGVAPAFQDTTAVKIQNEINKADLKYGTTSTLVKTKNDQDQYIIKVKGPGTISFDIVNIPDGVTTLLEDTADKMYKTGQITVVPTMTMKDHATTFRIYNAAGELKFPIKFTIGADESQFKVEYDTKLEAAKIGTEITPVALEAAFGPVKWTAKDLPSGLSLSIDKSVPYDKKVWIVGKLKRATKIDKNGQSIFKITAKNAPTGYETVVSQDYKVFSKPRITTTAIPAINLDKAYSAKINGTGGTSKDLSWVVKIDDYTETNSALPAMRGVIDSTSTKTFKSATAKLANQTLAGVKTLIVSQDKKTGMPTITGSLDRMPASGRIKVNVTVTVAKGTDAEDSADVEMLVSVKGTQAKITTSKVDSFSRTDTNESSDIIATGTLPIEMRAYIASADVGSLLNLPGNGDIDLADASNVTGIKFVYDATKKDGKAKLVSTGTGKYSFKNLPIRIQAGNAVSYNTKTKEIEHKSVDKVFKVTMPGVTPVWKKDGGTKAASSDITVFEQDGQPITDIVYTASADKPYRVSVSPESRNGIEAEIDDEAGTITFNGTPTAGKETKSTFTLTIQNTATKERTQAKLNIVGMQRPQVTTKMDSTGKATQSKVIEVGKSLNYKLSAKGSRRAFYSPSKAPDTHVKTLATKDIAYAAIKWELTNDGGNTAEDLVKLGLSFDAASGTFKGTAQAPSSDDQGNYKEYTFGVKPVNSCTTDADSANKIIVSIGVKGRKPKINTAAITLYRDSDDQYALEKNMLKTNLTNDSSANIRWTWAAGSDAMSKWGFSQITYDNTDEELKNLGKLSGTLKQATKGVNLKVSADNVGQEQTASIKFIIRDKDPEITGEDITFDGAKDMQAQETGTYSLSDVSKMMTGDTKMQWKITRAPSHSKLKARITPSSDGSEAVVTVTANKGVSPDIEATMAITVTNLSSKASATKEINIKVAAYVEALPAEKDALPEDKLAEEESSELAAEDDELSVGEGTVTYGEARGESTLTEAERKAISDSGYIIAAILPEITADESGQYDLDAVSLDTAAPEGYELVWFAFPRNVESSDDDAIAEFYDEAGAEVFAVPEARKVVPSPWLEKEVIYAPVIAVKAPSTTDAKTSFDQAQEGDTVTVQAIEEATQNSAQESAASEEATVISEEAKHEEAAE